MRKISLSIIVLALLAVSCTQMIAGSDAGAGKAAPDLTLKTTDNQTFKLSDLKGKVVVLDFWATWCPPCRESLPHLASVSADPALAKRGLKVIAINARETLEVAKNYVDKNHLSLTVALDSDGAAADAYKVNGFPTTVVIGRDGTIQHVIEGFGGKDTEDELDTAVEKALGTAEAGK